MKLNLNQLKEIDENGYVIAKNLRGLSLDQKIESSLSENK